MNEFAYGKDYANWKGWGEENFGKINAMETCYFDAEIRRAHVSQPSALNVLEIGYGNGTFLAYARAQNWLVTGTEINPHLVNIALNKGFRALSAQDMGSLGKESFDLIVAFDVLEHISPSHLLEFVEDLLSFLKRGGKFIARFPNADSPFGMVNQNGDLTHLSRIGVGVVRQLAEELETNLLFFGREAIPIPCGGMMRSARRAIGLSLFRIVDKVVSRIFYPNSPIDFCASNVTMILEKKVNG